VISIIPYLPRIGQALLAEGESHGRAPQTSKPAAPLSKGDLLIVAFRIPHLGFGAAIWAMTPQLHCDKLNAISRLFTPCPSQWPRCAQGPALTFPRPALQYASFRESGENAMNRHITVGTGQWSRVAGARRLRQVSNPFMAPGQAAPPYKQSWEITNQGTRNGYTKEYPSAYHESALPTRGAGQNSLSRGG